MLIEIKDSSFEPYQRLLEYQAEAGFSGKYGATAVFVGSMREFNQGDDVSAMSLEHYPGMTEKYLQKISEEAADKWDILDSLIVHRVGEMLPNDPIVLVAVWSAHRAEAFDASRYLMEELKLRAPFWKKESLVEQTRWVEKNT
ncbi:MAG: molybdenum cofactor biosynthesis protein MoaE [Gammaproteobacteria bacterium]|nr:molybdenum cofactor biosynthesis protein MoaE [Gammaproteobacteria bacterium]